ncbi:MAG: DUF2065 domain-containing protein [Deltaproteobacteria bacterium]|nr:DUF2065 domain-containing protein [Deltaproteobacteria bacterium]
MKLFLMVLGLALFIEGLPYFAFPNTLRNWLTKLIALPDKELRFSGLISMIIGLLFIYLGRD